MLVLSRKPGEEIVIGEHIRLTVLAIRGNQVRLGVAAPAHVPIQREELCLKAEESAAGRAPSEESS
ncbi:MAG: carbon storage regulator [Gemmataceae bacterium]